MMNIFCFFWVLMCSESISQKTVKLISEKKVYKFDFNAFKDIVYAIFFDFLFFLLEHIIKITIIFLFFVFYIFLFKKYEHIYETVVKKDLKTQNDLLKEKGYNEEKEPWPLFFNVVHYVATQIIPTVFNNVFKEIEILLYILLIIANIAYFKWHFQVKLAKKFMPFVVLDTLLFIILIKYIQFSFDHFEKEEKDFSHKTLKFVLRQYFEKFKEYIGIILAVIYALNIFTRAGAICYININGCL